MSSSNETPEKLRPFIFHGVDLQFSSKGKEALSDCPFCTRYKKFSVDVATGRWRCLVACSSGNIHTFIRKLWEESFEAASSTDYSELIKSRKLLDKEALKEWGVCRSLTTGEWMVPGGNDKGVISNLYLYKYAKKKQVLYSTPTLNHGLFGVQTFNPSLKRIYWCEGPWDGMALHEVMLCPKLPKELRGNVLSVPGCGQFSESWCSYAEDRDNIFLYDNDHPKVNPRTKELIEPAGIAGMKRAAAVISNSGIRVKSLQYLTWGVEGFNEDIPDGYDIRDVLTSE